MGLCGFGQCESVGGLTDKQTCKTMSLPAVQRHRGLSAVFLAIGRILTFHSISALPAQEKSCPVPLAQHSPVSELLPAGIYVGRMLTTMQPLAVLSAGCITAFILMTVTSYKILLQHGVTPGLGTEKQLSHHDYGETHPSVSLGNPCAPMSDWRGQRDAQDAPFQCERRWGLPSLHSQSGPVAVSG